MFLPFSPKARAWEPIAMELRRLVNASSDELVDPEVLAGKVGLCLCDAYSALAGFSQADRDHLLVAAASSWSGGVMPKALPNGKFVCIINPTHNRRRNRVTLMEEVVHIHRRHRPTGLLDIMPGLRVREYHADQEEEAYGVGTAVLLPWSQFYHRVNEGIAVSEMADEFDVTEALVKYRIGITGASNLYRNRCGTGGGKRRHPPSGSIIKNGSSQRGIL